ncbi:MAG: nucleotide pyrophosphohydrolase [Candidatus Korarchaeota archaeon]|nr:nucleotide pyrophosphohydrolase [Candidatus Korarchaeota archaeon]
MNADSINSLRRIVCKFRDERSWRKYHKPKDLAISIAIEAAELLEIFQWLKDEEVEQLTKKPKFIRKIAEEIADILIYLLSPSDILNIDLGKSVIEKVKINSEKYPINESNGDKVKIRRLKQFE